MTPQLRIAGYPSPLADGTHLDDHLAPPIPFDPAVAGAAEPIAAAPTPSSEGRNASTMTDALDPAAMDLGVGAPSWLAAAARLTRPLSVGALMAIPTIGTASVGAVAAIDESRGMAMARASIAFLGGIPGDIIFLIGTLATGYGVARTVEKLKRS